MYDILAPVKFALDRSVFVKSVLWNCASVKSTFERSMFCRSLFISFTLRKMVPASMQSVNVTPSKLHFVKSAPVKLAFVRFAFAKSASVSIHTKHTM